MTSGTSNQRQRFVLFEAIGAAGLAAAVVVCPVAVAGSVCLFLSSSACPFVPANASASVPHTFWCPLHCTPAAEYWRHGTQVALWNDCPGGPRDESDCCRYALPVRRSLCWVPLHQAGMLLSPPPFFPPANSVPWLCDQLPTLYVCTVPPWLPLCTENGMIESVYRKDSGITKVDVQFATYMSRGGQDRR